MIKFGSSGNIELFSIAGPSGQGHETVFPEIVGRELGLDPSLITARITNDSGKDVFAIPGSTHCILSKGSTC